MCAPHAGKMRKVDLIIHEIITKFNYFGFKTSVYVFFGRGVIESDFSTGSMQQQPKENATHVEREYKHVPRASLKPFT